MKIRRSELYRIMPILEALPRGIYVKFNYGLGKNMRSIRKEIQDWEDAINPDKKYREYEEERIKIAEECSKKEDGVPVMIPNPDGTRRYKIDEVKQESFDKKLEALKKKHQPAIDIQKEKIEKYNEGMKDEIEMDFHLIKFEDCPEDPSPKEWEAISYFVAEQPEGIQDKSKAKK